MSNNINILQICARYGGIQVSGSTTVLVRIHCIVNNHQYCSMLSLVCWHVGDFIHTKNCPGNSPILKLTPAMLFIIWHTEYTELTQFCHKLNIWKYIHFPQSCFATIVL